MLRCVCECRKSSKKWHQGAANKSMSARQSQHVAKFVSLNGLDIKAVRESVTVCHPLTQALQDKEAGEAHEAEVLRVKTLIKEAKAVRLPSRTCYAEALKRRTCPFRCALQIAGAKQRLKFRQLLGDTFQRPAAVINAEEAEEIFNKKLEKAKKARFG